MATAIRRNGAYAPLGANYYLDDAIIEAGERAEILYCRGLAFCASQNSDGYITDAQVVRVAIGLTGVPGRIKRLVDTGLWQKLHGGYQVRAWLKWNRSAEEIGRTKAQDRDRKAAARVPDSEQSPDGQDPESEPVPDGQDPPVRSESEPSRVEARARHSALHVSTRHNTTVEATPPDDPTSALLIEHVRTYATPPPPSAISSVRLAITKLVAQHTDPDLIRAGLRRMREKQLGPALLPDLVAESIPTSDRRPGRSTTDDRVAQAQAVTAKYRDTDPREISA